MEANTIIIAPLTFNFYSLRYPHTIKIKSSARNKLKQDSVVLVFQIRVIDKRRLKCKIGTLEEDVMKKINEMLKDIFCI